MPIPESATGSLYDAQRLLGFRDRVEVLILYDQTGVELDRLDHFWNIENPRARFGDNFESGLLKIAEDEEEAHDFPTIFAVAKIFRYEINQADPITDVETMVLSEGYALKGMDKPLGGRSMIWQGKFTVEVFARNFFRPPGGR